MERPGSLGDYFNNSGQRGRRSAYNILPDPHFLKGVFPMQNEEIHEFEPHSEGFELELKQFFSMGRRGSGRSAMLARVMVETAIESGRTISVIDHCLDERVGRNGVEHLMRQCQEVIENYKREGCQIHISKFNHSSGTMQLFLPKESFRDYDRIKIENNPTKFSNSPFSPMLLRELQVRKEFLLRRRLLLL